MTSIRFHAVELQAASSRRSANHPRIPPRGPDCETEVAPSRQARALAEGGFEAKGAFGQQRGYFGIGEDAPGGFDETGGAIRSSISCRKRNSTGSCSKAMLCATSWGMACQRRRSFSPAGRRRHWLMLSVQFIGHRLPPAAEFSRNITTCGMRLAKSWWWQGLESSFMRAGDFELNWIGFHKQTFRKCKDSNCHFAGF